MRPTVLWILGFSMAFPPAARAVEARLLSTLGGVIVIRGGQSAAVNGRTRLAAGDRIQTSPKGGATVAVGHSMLYLRGEAAAALGNSADKAQIELFRGSARVVVVNDATVSVKCPKLTAVLGKGVYQFVVHEDHSHLHTVAGRAIVTPGRDSSRLQRVLVQASFQQQDAVDVGPGETMVVPPPTDEKGAENLVQETPEDRQLRESLQGEAAEAAGGDVVEDEDDPYLDESLPPSTRGAEPTSMAAALGTQSFISSPGIATSFGGLSASFSLASGGLFSDATNDTTNGIVDYMGYPENGNFSSGDAFNGTIHLLTAESRYTVAGVSLTQAEKDSILGSGNNPAYFSIGTGPPPTTMVDATYTKSETIPTTFAVPGFDAFVIKFTEFEADKDAGIDPAGAAAAMPGSGIDGLYGNPPGQPGAIPNMTATTDERAVLNDRLTFALGEFRLRTVSGPNGESLEVAIRRSDQDRIMDQTPNPDLIAPHPDVEFMEVFDDSRFPPGTTVMVPVPGSFDSSSTRFSQVNGLRRAAVTTILAHQLYDVAQRTGQTRFVIDGRIVDISGYQK